MAPISRYPNCVKLPNHPCHTLGRSLTQTVPRDHRSPSPSATDQELTPGDRVEGLGNFGKPTGEFGTVERANEEDAVVKWDDDGRIRIHQPSLKKI
jgi:hypothetical protein